MAENYIEIYEAFLHVGNGCPNLERPPAARPSASSRFIVTKPVRGAHGGRPRRERCETRNAAEPARAADRDASRRSPFAGKPGETKVARRD
jgi:hypothetical protein